MCRSPLLDAADTIGCRCKNGRTLGVEQPCLCRHLTLHSLYLGHLSGSSMVTIASLPDGSSDLTEAMGVRKKGGLVREGAPMAAHDVAVGVAAPPLIRVVVGHKVARFCVPG